MLKNKTISADPELVEDGREGWWLRGGGCVRKEILLFWDL